MIKSCGIIYTGSEGTQTCTVGAEKYYWTAGHGNAQGSNFVWELRYFDGTSEYKQIDWVDWNTGQPDDVSPQSCMLIKSNDYKWADESCTSSFCYICEIDM